MAGRLERIWRKRCRRGPMDHALARRAPRRSGPDRRREAEPDPASDKRVARAVESCCGSAGPARRSGAATSESPHLGSRSGEQPREYAAGRVGSSARQRRNAPVRADGRTATRLARGAASPMGRRGLRLGPRGREECGRGSRRGGARGTPEARAVIASSESASAETPRGKPRPASAQISPTASSRAPSHPGPRFGTLAGQSPRTCVTRLPSWAPPRAPRRTPRGPRVRSPSDLLADAERPPAVRTP